MLDLLHTLNADPLGLMATSAFTVLLLGRLAEWLNNLIYQITEALGDRRARILEVGLKAVSDGRITKEELEDLLDEIRG